MSICLLVYVSLTLVCLSLCVSVGLYGGGVMTTNGDFWGLMGTKNHGDSG